MITLTGDSESIQKFSGDEKNLTVEEFAEHIVNHLEFHGMDSEFYLLDPHDASKVCFILQEDAEYSPSWVLKYFQDNPTRYDNYSTNNMDYAYKAIMPILDDSLKQSIHPLLPSDLKYGAILWIYVIHKARTVWFP